MSLATILGIALLIDGLDIAKGTISYLNNKRILTQFRKELKQFDVPSYDVWVAIPCYRNPSEVSECLETLVRKGFEPRKIVVADDQSNDGGETISAAKKYGVRIIEIKQKDVPKLRAQQAAVHAACEEGASYIISIDSDSVVRFKKRDVDYAIAEMLLLNLGIMSGRVLPKLSPKPSILERLQYIEYQQSMRACRGAMYSIEHKAGKSEVTTIEDLAKKYRLKRADSLCVSGAFGIYKAELLAQLLSQAKTHNWGVDREITHRALAKGTNIGYHDALIVLTAVPSKIVQHFKQRIRWGSFISSNYFNAPYRKNITNKFNRRARAVLWEGFKDVYVHPAKLAFLPSLLAEPIQLAAWFGFYECLSIFSCMAVQERKDFLASILMPIYRLYNLLIPTTIGYTQTIWREIKSLLKTA